MPSRLSAVPDERAATMGLHPCFWLCGARCVLEEVPVYAKLEGGERDASNRPGGICESLGPDVPNRVASRQDATSPVTAPSSATFQRLRSLVSDIYLTLWLLVNTICCT